MVRGGFLKIRQFLWTSYVYRPLCTFSFLIYYLNEGCSIELIEPLNSFRAAGLFH